MIAIPNTYSQRKSIRLKGYDYSQEGLYFVTICTQGHICLFGEIYQHEMILNEVGKMVEKCWLDISYYFPDIALHDYVIMPNHIHGILEIIVGTNNNSSEKIGIFESPKRTIGSVIRGFKNGVIKRLKETGLLEQILANNYSPLQQIKRNSIWQRNYYEHIIRNENSCNKITDYINLNPSNWKKDKYYN